MYTRSHASLDEMLKLTQSRESMMRGARVATLSNSTHDNTVMSRAALVTHQ